MNKIIAAIVLFFCVPAWSRVPIRAGIFIGGNRGNYFDHPLFYADKDAMKVRDVFVTVGNLDPDMAILVKNGSLDDVKLSFDHLGARVRLWKRGNSSPLQCVFYYSGHSGLDGLHMDGKTLAFRAFHRLIRAVDCDLDIIILDSCNSGQMLNLKGVTFSRGRRMAIGKAGKSEVIITSSAFDEFSQERDEFRGSVFTHYFVDALLGEADYNRDHRVSLFEAYHFAYINTLQQTFGQAAVMQHPSYSYKIKGFNDLVLTRTNKESAVVLLPDGKGNYAFLNLDSGVVFGGFRAGPRPRSIVLPGGRYLVRWSGPGGIKTARFRAGHDRIELDKLAFSTMTAANDPIKGKRTRFRVYLGVTGEFIQVLKPVSGLDPMAGRSYGIGLNLGIDGLLSAPGIMELYASFVDHRYGQTVFDTSIDTESRVYEFGVRMGLGFRLGQVERIDAGLYSGFMVIRAFWRSAFFERKCTATGFHGGVFAMNSIRLRRFLRLMLPRVDVGMQVYKDGHGLNILPVLGVGGGFVFDF